MNTTLSWIERNMDNFLLDQVKDIESLGLVGLHKEEQSLTFTKNIDLISSFRQQGHLEQCIEIPVEPMHIWSFPELTIRRHKDIQDLLTRRLIELMHTSPILNNVYIREPKIMRIPGIANFIPGSLNVEVQIRVRIM